MVIFGLLFTGIALIIVTIAATVIEITSIVFIAVGAVAIQRDKKREAEYNRTVLTNGQPAPKYKRKAYPRVLLALGLSVQIIHAISAVMTLVEKIIAG